MAKRRLTPEEQLLDLIEKGGKPEGTAGFKRKRKFFLGFSSLRNQWLSLGKVIKQGLLRIKAGLREPNLKLLNKVFLVISIILLCYSIVEFVFGRSAIEGIYRRRRPIKGKEPEEIIMPQDRPFLHYLEMVRRRNIFSPIVLKEAPKPEDKKKQVQKMAEDLSLVGISWGKEPVAMIEDRAVKKTYFLKKGDMINKFKIDDISKNKVILSYEKEKVELM